MRQDVKAYLQHFWDIKSKLFHKIYTKPKFWKLYLSFWPFFDSVYFDAGVVLLSSDDHHRLVGKVLLVIVDEPGRTFRNEIKSESERKQEETGSQS